MKSHPQSFIIFIFSVFLLFINDHFLKELYPGFLTGKLSDIFGLFAFGVFFCWIFPSFKRHVFVLTTMGFIFWKSEFSNAFIAIFSNHFWSIERFIDWTDLWCLLILFPVHFFLKRFPNSPFLKSQKWITYPLCFVVFTATSYNRNLDYNKEFELNMSKTELIHSINQYRIENKQPILSLHIQNGNYSYLQGNDSVFLYRRSLYDSIHQYKYYKSDTMYVCKSGRIFQSFSVGSVMDVSKTGYCDFVTAQILIKETDAGKCTLTLEQILTHNCMGMFEKDAETVEQDSLLSAFEKGFVRKLRN